MRAHVCLSLSASVGTLLMATCARAQGDDALTDSRNRECYHSVAYSAPDSCPDIQTLERRLDDTYRFQRGTFADCPECVRGIIIERAPHGAGYRMQIAGLEASSVTRQSCDELAEFALYAIEASDLPAPECTRTSAFVGVSATPFVNLANGEPLLATQVRLTIPVAQGEFTPFGFWLPPSQVRNQVPRNGRALNPDWELLNLEGYGAGVDVCWPVMNELLGIGQASALQLCGLGLWRRFGAQPSMGHASVEAELWTLGGGISWRTSVFETVHVEVAPTVMVGLGDAATYQAGTGERLYQYGGVEAQLRVGFSWEFMVRHTQNNTARLRSVSSSSISKPTTRHQLANPPVVALQQP